MRETRHKYETALFSALLLSSASAKYSPAIHKVPCCGTVLPKYRLLHLRQNVLVIKLHLVFFPIRSKVQ